MTEHGVNAEELALKRRYPTAHDLRRRARRVLPRFAFEYMDGGRARMPASRATGRRSTTCSWCRATPA